MVGMFKSKGMNPARIHSMADTRRQGTAKFSTLLDSLGKVMPSLTREFLDHLPPAFDMSPDDMVTKDDFTMMFDYNSTVKQASVGP